MKQVEEPINQNQISILKTSYTHLTRLLKESEFNKSLSRFIIAMYIGGKGWRL